MVNQNHEERGDGRRDGRRSVYRKRNVVPVAPSRAKGCLIAMGVLNVCMAVFLGTVSVLAGPSMFKMVELASLGVVALVCLVAGTVTLVFVGVRSHAWREVVRWSCRVGLVLLVLVAVMDVVLRSDSEYIAVCFVMLFVGAMCIDSVLHFLDFVEVGS
ncbi:hypothetical protein OZX74_06665 [Bifidobacterium sp. ESL0798]|uniref:hypothetical protein n=1 Tax=Bifidobacterium sp. ESL0798 TaxID=2983235 RepID=UPI0023F886A2|nr:hypothetical protein [Bifidobacterium sp. ESL0798]WEV73593.1 hypothetical protein OZX74_06665 [Bifidobacterium sp. ESL0798]